MEGRAFFSGSFTYIDKNVGENKACHMKHWLGVVVDLRSQNSLGINL